MVATYANQKKRTRRRERGRGREYKQSWYKCKSTGWGKERELSDTECLGGVSE